MVTDLDMFKHKLHRARGFSSMGRVNLVGNLIDIKVMNEDVNHLFICLTLPNIEHITDFLRKLLEKERE